MVHLHPHPFLQTNIKINYKNLIYKPETNPQEVLNLLQLSLVQIPTQNKLCMNIKDTNN